MLGDEKQLQSSSIMLKASEITALSRAALCESCWRWHEADTLGQDPEGASKVTPVMPPLDGCGAHRSEIRLCEDGEKASIG